MIGKPVEWLCNFRRAGRLSVMFGELSAAVELRRLFPGVTDMVEARECARTIAGGALGVHRALRPLKALCKSQLLHPGQPRWPPIVRQSG